MFVTTQAMRGEVMEKTKQVTYQLDATTNKVHCSLSSPRDQHSPPWLKLLNAHPAKVLHSKYAADHTTDTTDHTVDTTKATTTQG